MAPALGVNNSGEVVLANYWYSQGTLTAFPLGFAGQAINASGHIAGNYGIYYCGTATGLPTPLEQDVVPLYSAPAINDSGAVVINYLLTSTAWGSDLYSNGALTRINIPYDIDGCGYAFTAYAMNDSEQIIGNCEASGPVFSYDGTSNAVISLGIVGWGVCD